MASSMVFILALALSSQVRAQATCSGQDIPEARGLAQRYPPTFQIATILDGDTEARDLYNTILSTNAAALKVAPAKAPNGTLDLSGYDARADPNCWWSQSQCTVPKAAGLLEDYYFCPQASTWALTYDDGPTCYHDKLYDFLAAHNQLVSLYYIGTNVIQWPLEAQKGYLAGHEICVHTWSHHYTTSLTNEQIFAELYYTKKLIKEVTGASVRCWRPPFGDLDDRARTIATALDLRAHIWDHDTFDWSMNSGASPAAIAANYAKIIEADHSQSGVVVLSHEISDATCDMSMSEYPKIARSFDHIVPVSTCNNDPVVMAEDSEPVLPVFDQYVSGGRGKNRTADNFWSKDDLVFMGNGPLANDGASSSAYAASSSASALPSTSAPTSASGSASSASAAPAISVSPAAHAADTSSGAVPQSAVSLTMLLSMLGLFLFAF